MGVGRGELGFMQISTAYKLGMVSLGVYGGTVWGLLLASIGGPFMFRAAVKFAQGQESCCRPAGCEPCDYCSVILTDSGSSYCLDCYFLSPSICHCGLALTLYGLPGVGWWQFGYLREPACSSGVSTRSSLHFRP